MIDTRYEALDRLARSTQAVAPGSPQAAGAGMQPPPLMGEPRDARWSVPDAHIAAGRDVWLLHPWSLGSGPKEGDTGALLIGVGFEDLHAMTPWSARRWNFVGEGLRARTSTLWWGSVQSIAQALRSARTVGWHSEPHADSALGSLQTQLQTEHPHPVVTAFSEPGLFAPVEPYCESFAKWWRLTNRHFPAHP